MPSKKGSIPYLAKLARARAKRTEKYFNMIISDKTLPRNQRAAASATKHQIKQAILATYTGRRPLNNKQLQAIRENIYRLDAITESSKIARGKHGASNFFTQSQINLASKVYYGADAALEAAANPSIYTREQVKIFYRATQAIWQNQDGTPTETTKINKRIMRYFNTTSLQTAFNRVMSSKNVQVALEVAEGRIDQNAQLTPEQEYYYSKAESMDVDQNHEGSPDYLVYVVQFDPSKPWSEQLE